MKSGSEQRKTFKLARKKTNWWRLEIDRKTNIISLIAFLLSIASVGSQIYFFFKGPIISLQTPEMIVFYRGEEVVNGKSYLKISARMTFVNSGQPGFNDAISKEYAVLVLDGKKYLLFWKDFVSTDAIGAKFIINKKEDAAPVVVNAGSAISHETSFSPTYMLLKNGKTGDNFFEFDKFKEIIGKVNNAQVYVGFETVSGLKGGVKCNLIVDVRFRKYIENQWANPTCEHNVNWFEYYDPN